MMTAGFDKSAFPFFSASICIFCLHLHCDISKARTLARLNGLGRGSMESLYKGII